MSPSKVIAQLKAGADRALIEKWRPFCQVRAVPYDKQDLKVGSVLAQRGAWNRKFIVTHIVWNKANGGHQNGTIGIKFIGCLYATGVMEFTDKAGVRELQLSRYYQKDTKGGDGWGSASIDGSNLIVVEPTG